jgi:hypothetical protein
MVIIPIFEIAAGAHSQAVSHGFGSQPSEVADRRAACSRFGGVAGCNDSRRSGLASSLSFVAASKRTQAFMDRRALVIVWMKVDVITGKIGNSWKAKSAFR